MHMNAYENESAVEVVCTGCGRRFIASFEGPDSRYVEYSLCPDCYDETDTSGLAGWTDEPDRASS